MSKPIIEVCNLSKQYHIGLKEQANRTFREALVDTVAAPVRNFKHLRQLNKFEESETPDTIWALHDVSFEVQPGEVVGIIGRNGAGKSTLLKILSRITEPTVGEVRMRGRVASLLEVGTGFHPELTGRENIYLNGTILGMRRAEIDRKFDEIVAFSEIEKFLDTPVKRYSSGMYVRLAFAVAAHLEPEILLVDEVLAVGDAAFQKKCLGKMGDVAKEGRTVLFVSHNMAAVESLCNKAILINDSTIHYTGSTSDTISKYISLGQNNYPQQEPGIAILGHRENKYGNGDLIIKKIQLKNSQNIHTSTFLMGEKLQVIIDVYGMSKYPNSQIGIIIKTNSDQWLTSINTGMTCDHVQLPRKQKEQAILTIPQVPLTPGTYWIDISIAQQGIERIDYIEKAIEFTIESSDIYGTGYQISSYFGVFYLSASWQID